MRLYEEKTTVAGRRLSARDQMHGPHIQTEKRTRKRHHIKEALVTCSLYGLIHRLPESLQPSRGADGTGKP